MVRSLTVDADDAFVYAGTTSGDVLQARRRLGGVRRLRGLRGPGGVPTGVLGREWAGASKQ
jgi:hypothetical protein